MMKAARSTTGATAGTKLTRRNLLRGAALGAGALALYAGEIERHWIDHRKISIPIAGLSEAMDGFRMVQLSDIHLEEFTEPFFLRDAVRRVNAMKPDAVVLTGDFITTYARTKRFPERAIQVCAEILTGLECRSIHGILGNHDAMVDPAAVAAILEARGIPILRNQHVALERGGGRLWLAGIDDMLAGRPDLDKTIPPQIRNISDEPVILLGHEPDPALKIVRQPAGASVRLMLSGHTHGGQVRLPFFGALTLPPMGERFAEGLFTLGPMKLYVNRGLGTVGVPFRFDCPPEITEITLRAG
jgi:predicted MPP superfamily phosphohydrolase